MARILAVDDDPRIRRFVTRVLREAGHRVRTVGDAESALAQLLGARPDLFLLDINLPGMHGLALARKLREGRGTESIPVVVFSVRTDPRDKVAAYASGAVTYLEKPIRKEALLEAVQGALEFARRRSRRRRSP
jgi:DNA-binding response OmpR family regulator